MKRKLPDDDIVRGLYESGKSTGEIAELFDVKPVTVVSFLRSRNIPRRLPGEAARLAVAAGRYPKARYWLGRKQPRDMVERRTEKIRGDKHWLWKGGKDRRLYRKVVEKVVCVQCGSRINLGLHHINFDHFDDRPENIQVLCVSCHMSLHKKAYWNAVHAGTEPPISNGRVGWVKGGDDKNGGNLPRGE